MIKRSNYRGYYSGDAKALAQALLSDAPVVESLIAAEKCLTVALYRHEGMLFLYMEALEETLEGWDEEHYKKIHITNGYKF